MNYFRRPKIANKSLARSSQATIRGNTRRHDADGVVSSPYFPNASVGQDITIASQSGSVTYTLTSNKISEIITGLNAGGALSSVFAEAFDWDGCLGVRSTVSGATSYIEVTGGTAASALGFNLGTQRFVSRGGDIPSSGEGRLGVSFGSAIANPGENLTTSAINRGIGRVAANSDVLWADVSREGVVVKNVALISVGSTTSSTPLNSISIASVAGATQRVYTGGQVASSPAKVLNAGASVAELARFYFLVDTETGALAPSSITDVTSSAGGSTILGSEQQILGATAITSIPNGSTIQVDTVNFTSLNVLPGDYVKITNATNNTPWSNNGYKWAVESVLNATHIAVRPLSASEQVRCGETLVADSQPVLELNSDGSGFGNITVTRGPWATNAYLEVSPAIPKGATYELWAAVPANLHDVGTHELGAASQIAAASAVFTELPAHSVLPDFIVVAPTIVSISLSDVVVSAFYVRSRGRLVRVPSCALTRDSASAEYIAWNTNTCQLEISATSGHLGTNYLFVAKLNANSSTYELAGRILNTRDCILTVGVGQQFSTLKSAVDYARSVSGVNSYEIVVCDTHISIPTVLNLDFPVKVRGLTINTLIENDGGSVFPFTGLAADQGVVIENFTAITTGIPNFLTAYPYITLRNVRRLGGDNVHYIHAYRDIKLTIPSIGANRGTMVGVTLPDYDTAIYNSVEAAKTLLRDEQTVVHANLRSAINNDMITADNAIRNLVIPWTTATLYQPPGCDPWVVIPNSLVQYCKDSFGFVHFRGMLQVPISGMINASSYAIVELPSGVRPTNTVDYFVGILGDPNSSLATQMLKFSVNNAGFTGFLQVYGTTSTALTGSTYILGLSGVTYYAG
jgi:hypothetical protein